LCKKYILDLFFALTLPCLTVMMNLHSGDSTVDTQMNLLENIMTLDSEHLRRAMRAWTTGVAVVTAQHDGQRYGMTVNSFASVSLEPPVISVTLRRLTHTHTLVEASREFSVTVLSAKQKGLSDRFAGKIANILDRFDGVQTETLAIQAPLIRAGLAFFNCRVLHALHFGENTLFIAEVVAVRGEGEGDPLVYHNRVYWKLSQPPLA
jgi:flavin reductase (DIM6/NTAB) family NADH-FMN oxidoreductase RutF